MLQVRYLWSWLWLEALLEYADELRRKKEEEKQNKLKNPNSLSEKHESWREKSVFFLVVEEMMHRLKSVFNTLW